MKKSNKLTAAGVGLMIAAVAGFGPALADDGSNALTTKDTPYDISKINAIPSADESELSSEQKDEKDSTPSAGETADVVTPTPSATGESTPESDKTEATDENKESVTDEEKQDLTAGEGENKAEADVQDKAGAENEGTAENKDQNAGAPAADAETGDGTAQGTSQGATDSEPAQTGTPSESVPATSTAYKVVNPVSSRPSSNADSKVETTDLLVPFLSGTVSTTEAPVSSGVGEPTANGQSAVLWFELPPVAGPALTPGEKTAPLLGDAVYEAAAATEAVAAADSAQSGVNAAVIPATVDATAQGSASAGVQMSAVPAAAPQAQESGVMARSLARTGSVAQYAALMSAVAMIVGVGMLVGAAATRRRQIR